MTVESSERDGNTRSSYLSAEKPAWVEKQHLEPCIEQLIGSGWRKEYDRAIRHHPVCLTYTLSTS